MEEPKGVMEVSKRLGLRQSTAHRLLRTLDATGLVTQDVSNRKYYLGPLFWRAATEAYAMHKSLTSCALEEMKPLRDITGETVGLYVQAGTQRQLLEGVESRHPIKYVVEKGYEAPIYTGAPGRVLLSLLKESDLKALVSQMELPLVGPRAITSKSALIEEVARTRERGYAISSGEWAAGATAITAPIRGYFCPAALSVFGPSFRIGDPTSFLHDLLESANRISARMLEINQTRLKNSALGLP